jgi:DNA polymerase I-like protein with 3'-5' exonuclease and polymerase domains
MKYLVLDIETKDPYISRKLGSGWVFKYHNIPNCDYELLGTAYRTHEGKTGYTEDLELIKQLVGDHDAVICHNCSYDIGGLRAVGIDSLKDKPLYDTEVMSRLYNSSLTSHSLDGISRRYLKLNKNNKRLTDDVFNLDLFPYLVKEVNAKKRAEKNGEEYVRERPCEKRLEKWCKNNMDIIQKASFSTVAEYAIDDVKLTWELFEYFRDKIDMSIAYKYSMVTHICIDYRIRGIRVDLKRVRELRDEMIPLIKERYDKCFKIAREEFNINSPQDMPMIFDKLGIKYPVTATGRPSMTTPWLEQQEHPLCKAIVEARKALKIDRDFIQKVLDIQQYTDYNMGAGDYGRVFPELHMLRARTGRFSCVTGDTLIRTDRGYIKAYNVQLGDMVLTHKNRYRAVTTCIKNMNQDVYRLTTDKGTLKCTGDHKVLTTKGWKKVNDLKEGDHIECIKEMGSSTGEYKEGAKHVQVREFINNTGDSSELEYNSTKCQAHPTGTFTRGRVQDFESGKILSFKDRKLKSDVWKDWRAASSLCWGVPGQQRVCYLFGKGQESTVPSLYNGKRTGDGFITTTSTCSPYRRGQDEQLDRQLSTMYKQRAQRDTLQAERREQHRATVKSIHYIGRLEVYDFTVDEDHSYVSNGILSHNCTGYNMQQIPSRDPVFGPMCRSMFIPEDGDKWFAIDFSNQEGRLQVHYANMLKCEGASSLAKAFNNDPNIDMHQKVADMVGIGRREAKSINLGVSYGMGVSKLASQLGVPVNKAKIILDKYNRMAPYLYQLNQKCMKAMEVRGYIKTIGGRLSSIDPPMYIDGKKVTFEYKALNKLIQGSAADQTIEAMIMAYNEDIPVLLPVHDELCMSGNEEQAKRLKEIMETAVKLTVPVVAEYEEHGGNNWSECK